MEHAVFGKNVKIKHPPQREHRIENEDDIGNGRGGNLFFLE